MASSTTTRKPANGDRERMDGDHAQQAPENRRTVDAPAGAERSADIVLGAAVIAMGLVWWRGSTSSPRSRSCRP